MYDEFTSSNGFFLPFGLSLFLKTRLRSCSSSLNKNIKLIKLYLKISSTFKYIQSIRCMCITHLLTKFFLYLFTQFSSQTLKRTVNAVVVKIRTRGRVIIYGSLMTSVPDIADILRHISGSMYMY